MKSEYSWMENMAAVIMYKALKCFRRKTVSERCGLSYKMTLQKHVIERRYWIIIDLTWNFQIWYTNLRKRLPALIEWFGSHSSPGNSLQARFLGLQILSDYTSKVEFWLHLYDSKFFSLISSFVGAFLLAWTKSALTSSRIFFERRTNICLFCCSIGTSSTFA